MRNYKAAIVQSAPIFLNLEESLEKCCNLTTEAAKQGAEIIAFGESWLPGYPVWLDNAPKAAFWNYPPAKELYTALFNNALEIPGEHFQKLLDTARKNKVVLLINIHERIGATLYNTSAYIQSNGADFVLHRKLVPTYAERLVWGRGDGSTLNTLSTQYGTIGGLICWEHWMPHARAAMHSMNETVHYACWPSVNDIHLLASRNYAFEGQCFVLAAGSVLSKRQMIEGAESLGSFSADALDLLRSIEMNDDEYLLNGRSCIIAPDSQIIAQAPENEEHILIAELDNNLVTQGKLFLDVNGHYSRPDIFTLSVNNERNINIENQ